MRSAFSLVELSIVLVILGLLTGGILAGQSLIRASELRAVTTEYQRYAAAVHTFRDKYFALPGDMSNATSFWLKDNTNCAGHTGAAAAAGLGTCNGNGNGLIASAAAASATGEMFQFWRQLAFAGLIEGTYTGLAGPGTSSAGYDNVIGTNAPRSRISNAGWSTTDLTNFPGDTYTYNFNFGNVLTVGTASTSYLAYWPFLKPEEAWNIDTKLDDGKPGLGKVMSNWNAACTNSGSNTGFTGDYNLSGTSVACGLVFPKTF